MSSPTNETDPLPEFEIELEAVDYWRTGKGDELVPGKNGNPKRPKRPDDLPLMEQRILWKDDKFAGFAEQLVLPAAGIKGALRHRTLFHLRRIGLAKSELVTEGALDDLFGAVKAEGRTGRAGRLFLDDCLLDPKHETTDIIDHNGIDRFTGGVRRGVLFSEQVLYQSTIMIRGRIDEVAAGGASQIDADVRRAFAMALDDLMSERLALGAAAAKGHGYFRGSFTKKTGWLETGKRQ